MVTLLIISIYILFVTTVFWPVMHVISDNLYTLTERQHQLGSLAFGVVFVLADTIASSSNATIPTPGYSIRQSIVGTSDDNEHDE